MNAITTKLSSKGQLVLPKALRDKLKWSAGTELVVEDTPRGVVIRAARPFPPTTLDQVAGSLKKYYTGPPKTIEEMDQAITDEIAARHARGRY